MSDIHAAFVLMTASMALGGCAAYTAQAANQAAATQIAAASAAPLTPSGPAETLVEHTDESLGWAASVVKVDFAPNQHHLTVKLFGTAGGDPAMNGLYTYIAFLSGPHEGWRVYRLGDFLDYRILSASGGRIDLEIRESIMSGAGEIGSRTRRVIIRWAPNAGHAAPSGVTLTPAR